ncbi:MAG TPA: hypothetical protein P5218_15865, partial [Planctomycetota bacterium]|nr:hypothetical protein [Planctomycetota bacterium]
DGDSLDVKGEYVFDTNPADPDTDDDSIPDGFEITFGMNPRVADSGEDFDGDGLTNLQEYQGGTDPLAADSDHDGLKDKWETDHGFNPIDPADGAADQDSDGMTNAWEVRHGLDYTNPADATQDPDEDDLTNKQEFDLGTDPNNSDSDGDGLNDGDEINGWEFVYVDADNVTKRTWVTANPCTASCRTGWRCTPWSWAVPIDPAMWGCAVWWMPRPGSKPTRMSTAIAPTRFA